MDDCAQIRYDIVSGKYILTYLGFFKSVIDGFGGPYKRCISPMFDMVTYEFKLFNAFFTSKEYFTYA